ncbi:hypothetical protein PEC106664_42050 [Pectobacterium carotovorum subsp. carotovorum]|nr:MULTISPECIES: hypothetical protein [Pectobacterium]MBK4826220.1 hypothetical protein [Pectobacterium carotovorum subsp. carotovorum]GKV83431.1 hypothetical protein PEC106664_42050 [Pectobacterium carotovorum subsp. carotovorum]
MFVARWPSDIYRRSALPEQGKRRATDGAEFALHRPAASQRTG